MVSNVSFTHWWNIILIATLYNSRYITHPHHWLPWQVVPLGMLANQNWYCLLYFPMCAITRKDWFSIHISITRFVRAVLVDGTPGCISQTTWVHYSDVIMSEMASQMARASIVCSASLFVQAQISILEYCSKVNCKNINVTASNVVSFDFYPAAFKGSGLLSSPEQAGGREGRQAPEHSNVHNFSGIIFKHGTDIYYPKISDEYDHGSSASLNMRIMDHLMSQPLLTFLNSFFKLKSPHLAYR